MAGGPSEDDRVGSVEPVTSSTCDTYWGSHGCDLPVGHDSEQEHPVHECSIPDYDEEGDVTGKLVCSEAQYVDEETIRNRFRTQDGLWTDWQEIKLELFRMDEEKVR